MEENKKKLYMPSNISTQTEIVKGITKKELKHFCYLLIIDTIISMVLFLIYNIEIGLISLLISITISYFLVVKQSDGSFSTVKFITLIYKFYTKQRCYKYKYKDFWSETYDKKR